MRTVRLYKNGKQQSQPEEEEEPQVLKVKYYPGGKLMRTCVYLEGIKNGEEKIYDPSGRVRMVRRYKDGEQQGQTEHHSLLQISKQE